MAVADELFVFRTFLRLQRVGLSQIERCGYQMSKISEEEQN